MSVEEKLQLLPGHVWYKDIAEVMDTVEDMDRVVDMGMTVCMEVESLGDHKWSDLLRSLLSLL